MWQFFQLHFKVGFIWIVHFWKKKCNSTTVNFFQFGEPVSPCWVQIKVRMAKGTFLFWHWIKLFCDGVLFGSGAPPVPVIRKLSCSVQPTKAMKLTSAYLIEVINYLGVSGNLLQWSVATRWNCSHIGLVLLMLTLQRCLWKIWHCVILYIFFTLFLQMLA